MDVYHVMVRVTQEQEEWSAIGWWHKPEDPLEACRVLGNIVREINRGLVGLLRNSLYGMVVEITTRLIDGALREEVKKALRLAADWPHTSLTWIPMEKPGAARRVKDNG